MLSSSIQDGIANTILRQMGAVKIKTMPANINIVTFMLDEERNVELQYVYEMKENETIYLERTAPFPYFLGEPNDTDDLIDIIAEDVKLHQEAYAFGNYETYMEIGQKATAVRQRLDDMLKNKKVADPEDLERIKKELDDVLDWFEEAEDNMVDEEDSDRFFDKVRGVGQQVREFVKQRTSNED